MSAPLWDYLASKGIAGVAVRDMTVTPGEHVNELHPGRVIPPFLELVLPRTLRGQRLNGWLLESGSIPKAEMFTGSGLPLFVNERVKELLVAYAVSGLEFEEASASSQ